MSSIRLGEKGYVYILSNASMPEILKIGATTLDPITRAKQLSAATAAATPFNVLYYRAVQDVNEAERSMHAAFAHCRVSEGREFFRVSLYEAATTLDRLCGGGCGLEFSPPTPMAELFASFPDDGTDRELTEEERAACRALETKIGLT